VSQLKNNVSINMRAVQGIKKERVSSHSEANYVVCCSLLIIFFTYVILCRKCNWEKTTNNIKRIVNFDHFIEFGCLFSRVIRDWPLILMRTYSSIQIFTGWSDFLNMTSTDLLIITINYEKMFRNLTTFLYLGQP
jgi:hypothetical protein